MTVVAGKVRRPGHPGLSWDEFAELRLSQFLPKTTVRPLRAWEFMDRVWVGEAAGFTEWLRLRDEPRVLRSMALDFARLPDADAARILEQLRTTLRFGMSRQAVEQALGAPNQVGVFQRATDRETLVFRPRQRRAYHLHCTVQKTMGLVYLVVMRGDWSTAAKKRAGSKP